MVAWTLSRKPRREGLAPAERLHASAVAASRDAQLYVGMGVPDSVEGRFELLTLHIILLVERLRAEAGAGEGLRQALFDTYISHLDGAMREMGVGDLSMGKRMRKLGEAFYGRATSYAAALKLAPDLSALQSVLARTVLEGVDFDPAPLADYVARAHAALAAGGREALLAGDPSWAAP